MDLDFHFKRAIENNQAALTRIVAGLVALLAAQGAITKLPLPLYRKLARALHKVESAVRRLIVVAAWKVAVPVSPARPLPAGMVIHRKGPTGARRWTFPLFDPRQIYDWNEPDPAAGGPRIRFVGEADPRSQFLSLFASPKDDLSSEAATLRLRKRLQAVEHALTHLSNEAKRLVRWRTRRAAMKDAKFTSPLRPGPPPGRNKSSKAEIESILSECHALAWDAIWSDSS